MVKYKQIRNKYKNKFEWQFITFKALLNNVKLWTTIITVYAYNNDNENGEHSLRLLVIIAIKTKYLCFK